jgi:hypothetical protein
VLRPAPATTTRFMIPYSDVGVEFGTWRASYSALA